MKKLVGAGNLYVDVSPENQTQPVVIHFLTGIVDGRLPARLVEALKLVHLGVIPRIYFKIARFVAVPGSKEKRTRKLTDITSILKATFGVQNVRYSEVSVSNDRILICASYFNGTSESPSKPPPLIGSAKP